MDSSGPKKEKLLACIGPSPSAAGLIDHAVSMASRLDARWFAVYVEDPKMLVGRESERKRALDNLRLAEHSGAEAVTLAGRDVAEEIIRFAREHGISRIVAGKPRRSLRTSILSGSPVDRLIRLSGEIDIIITAGGPGKSKGTIHAPRRKGEQLSDYGTGFLFLALATFLCFAMYPYFQLSNLLMVYLLAVLLTATGCGRKPAMLVSLLSVLAFDFFFVPPRFRFTVEDAQYIVTFVVMFLVAVVISHLTTRMREQTEEARLQHRQAAAMHGLSRQLAGTRGIEDILKVAVRYVSDIFDCKVLAMLPDSQGRLSTAAGDPSSVFQKDILREMDVARLAFNTGQTRGWETGTSSSAQVLCVPLQTGGPSLGVLVLKPEAPNRLPASEQADLLESLAKQVALALEVERLASGGSACPAQQPGSGPDAPD